MIDNSAVSRLLSSTPEGKSEATFAMLISNQEAVNQAQHLRKGEPVFDFLALETRAAKKYLRQCERRDRKKAARRVLQMSRRAGISIVNLLSETRGPRMRDGQACKDVEAYVVDKQQRYSRCTQCGTEFVDGQGRKILSNFAFCRESLSVAGECKKAYVAGLSSPSKAEPKFNIVTPEDHGWAGRQRPLRRLKSGWEADTENVLPELQRGIGRSGHGKRVTKSV